MEVESVLKCSNIFKRPSFQKLDIQTNQFSIADFCTNILILLKITRPNLVRGSAATMPRGGRLGLCICPVFTEFAGGERGACPWWGSEFACGAQNLVRLTPKRTFAHNHFEQTQKGSSVHKVELLEIWNLNYLDVEIRVVYF